jgi:hypothetical protein
VSLRFSYLSNSERILPTLIAAGDGYKFLITVMSGPLLYLLERVGHPTAKADGYGWAVNTSGWPTSPGDGRHTTMAGGPLWRVWADAGYRLLQGRFTGGRGMSAGL